LAFGAGRLGYYTFWSHYNIGVDLVHTNAMLLYDPSDEKGYRTTEIYDAVKKADTVLFLGHGTSDSLFASGSDETELFGKANVMLLANKQLFLLACNSAEFIKKYKLTNAIGFGKMPTSLDDARHWKNLHKTTIEDFSRDNIDIYNKALVDALCNSISLETISDYSLFRERFKFQVSREIVKCLIPHKDKENYRKIADLLFYLQKDMIIKQ
jgi:hypothetical protein